MACRRAAWRTSGAGLERPFLDADELNGQPAVPCPRTVSTCCRSGARLRFPWPCWSAQLQRGRPVAEFQSRRCRSRQIVEEADLAGKREQRQCHLMDKEWPLLPPIWSSTWSTAPAGASGRISSPFAPAGFAAALQYAAPAPRIRRWVRTAAADWRQPLPPVTSSMRPRLSPMFHSAIWWGWHLSAPVWSRQDGTGCRPR